MINPINNSNTIGLTHLDNDKNNFKYHSFKAEERSPQPSTQVIKTLCLDTIISPRESFASSQDSSLELITSLLLTTWPNEFVYHLSERS